MGNRSLFFEHIDILIILNHFIMKKRNLKSLKLNKKSISKLDQELNKGGTLRSFICSYPNGTSCDINYPHICP